MPDLIPAPPAADPTPVGGADATSLDEFLRALRDDARLRPGDVFGAFTIRRLLRSGGMGEAYLAEQAPLGRLTIVKVVRGVGSDEVREQFRSEWAVGGRLHHTNLVPVYAAGHKGDRDYYVMPYVRGASLREVIRAVTARAAAPGGARDLAVPALVAELADAKDRAFLRPWEKFAPPAEAALPDRPELPRAYYEWAARRMVETADAVETAHRAGVLHLDLKPSNVLVETPSDLAKVIDFGLSRRFDPAAGACPEVACEPGGVPGYAAPEVLARGRADRRADVHGLGACLFELVTLRRPGYTGPVAGPSDLVAVARKATAAEPADRYPSAAAFAADVRRWLDGRLPAARSGWRHLPRALGLWARRNTAWVVTAAVVLAAVASASGAAVVIQNRENARERDRLNAEKREAERERDRLEAQQKFEKALVESQDYVLRTPPATDWPAAAQTKLRDVLRLRPGADVRDYAAHALIGLDAVLVYQHSLPGPPKFAQGLSAVAFGPGGRVVAGGWDPALIRTHGERTAGVLWDGNLATKVATTSLVGAGPVAFPDAASPLQLVHTAEPEMSLTLWNVATHTAELEIPLPGVGRVLRAALAANGRYAAASFVPDRLLGQVAKPTTLVWAIDRKPGAATARKLHEWATDEKAFVCTLAFTPDGEFVATGSAVGEVVVRATATGAEVARFPEGDLPVTALAFGRNYRRPSGENVAPVGPAGGWLLAAGSNGGELSVWNLRSKTRTNAFYGSEHAVYAVAFSPDGTLLASAGRNPAFVWDVGTGRPLLRVQLPGSTALRSWTEGVAFSPEGDRLAFASPGVFTDGGLDVFRLDDGRGVRSYRGLTGVVERVWLSPSGKWVAALSQNWQLGVWDRKTGRAEYVWDVPPGITSDNADVAFDKGDTEVLFASGKRVSRWTLKDGERTAVWTLPQGLNDQLLVRPGEAPLLVRRDPMPTADVRMYLQARELGPDGRLTLRYQVPPEECPAENMNGLTLSADGRFLMTDIKTGPTYRPHLFDGLTGKPIPLDRAGVPTAVAGTLSRTGRVLILNEPVEPVYRHHLFRLPDFRPLGVHVSNALNYTDDSGQLGLAWEFESPATTGVALYRIGEGRPVVTFDAGRPPAGPSMIMSADGRFVCWGRRDGTVCVADVNRCLEQLAPFGKR